MRYLRKFKTTTEYHEYLSGSDVWLPRVSYIVNGGDHVNNGKTKDDDDGPSWIDFSRLGTEFIQVANEGTMYFTDQVYGNIKYTAFVEADALCIQTIDLTTGQFTNDAYVDDANSQIVVNYPTGVTKTYSI